jgi:hypothetical protein
VRTVSPLALPLPSARPSAILLTVRSRGGAAKPLEGLDFDVDDADDADDSGRAAAGEKKERSGLQSHAMN